MSKVKRVYVEKKPDYAVKAKELHEEIKNYLGIMMCVRPCLTESRHLRTPQPA